ncbi:glycosyltransferase family 1 protein [Candidatus Parcubacteria bacterium]|nr:MAG: glycosyltransferase family 1 protein [Candidatus Parcubacteria bacterium]
MRIGIDARLWQESGVGRYIRNLVNGLLILDDKNEYVLFVDSQNCQKLKAQSSKLKAQIKNGKWKLVATEIRWHTIEEQIKLSKILNNEKLDLMHFPYFSVPIFYNKPFVVTIHDLIIYHYPTGKASTLPLPLYQLKHQAYKYIISKAAKKAKKIIAPLECTKKDIIKTLNIAQEKVDVTYEGFDNNIQQKNIDFSIKNSIENVKYLLYVGNAYPHKNLEKLIEAFLEYKKEKNDNNVKLLLVGKEDYFYKQLEQKIKRNPDIEILHNIDDNNLSYLYQNAVALVAPSLMEGFGLTALEAMFNSCLVLASDIPSFKEICGEAAIYFDPKNTEDIKEKIKKVYNLDTQKRKEYILKEKKRISAFSWDKMVKKTLKIYEDCNSV